MARSLILDPAIRHLLEARNIRPAAALRSAELPEDLFGRARPSVSPEGLNRLFSVLREMLTPEAPGLLIGQAMAADTFNPASFAALCSGTFAIAAERISAYRTLTGPVHMEVHSMTGGLEVTLEAENRGELPEEYIAAELVNLLALARQGTGDTLKPVAVEMRRPPSQGSYGDYIGTRINPGPFNRLVFSPRDGSKGFALPDPAMFDRFPKDLRTRLDGLAEDASIIARVRAVLVEMLPAGQGDIAHVAARLGTSARTLQRWLGKEGVRYQAVLRDVREVLARHYLKTSAHTSIEIAFLLGYDDPNSFTRAFHVWSGHTPEAYRAS